MRVNPRIRLTVNTNCIHSSHYLYRLNMQSCTHKSHIDKHYVYFPTLTKRSYESKCTLNGCAVQPPLRHSTQASLLLVMVTSRK